MSVTMAAASATVTAARATRRRAWTTHGLSALFLLAWGAAAAVLPSYLLPGPVAVAGQATALLATPKFLLHGLFSLWHILSSIAAAFVIGLLLAVMMRLAPATRMAINQRLNPFLSSFSTIGWVFLSVIWFGVNEVTVIFVVTVTLLPFALSNLRAGLDELDQELIEMARSFGRGQARLIVRMLLPLLVPYIFATLRICLGVAWKVVLTAELFGGTSGLGYLISRARAEFDTPVIFAIIAIIVVFVYVSDRLLLEPVQLRLRRNYAVT